ncbi:hypothetical protein LTS08_000801 [Lithohypha guttulata]|nr:hypothetical protein LTS08_000801 [Lithohypha guttulata]
MGDASDLAQQVLSGDLLELVQLVDPSEVIAATHADYISNTQAWSTSRDKKPRLVLRPKSVASLSGIVAFLSKRDLDYKVRSQGFGSASATDVLISLSAFDDFEFNKEEEYVILGAGGSWAGYYDRMDAVAPDWTIVCARTPSIGIGGSTLCSGFSWLSSEYGCVSDPANLLDARVVTADGRVFWASTDPDLFWAMRGTESGFAIVTHFKFRARRYPENGKLWAGPILIPRNKVSEAAKGVISMVEKHRKGEMSPKAAMFLYVMKAELLHFIGATMDMLVIHAFDGRGEKEGREEFKWALDIDGALDQTRGDMTIRQVAQLQEHIGNLRGTAECYWSPMALTNEEMSESVILKSFEWWMSLQQEPNSIADNDWLLFELFACKDNLNGRHSSAWPRPVGYKHMLLVGAGCATGSTGELSNKAKQHVIDASMRILGKPLSETAVAPNAIEEFHSIEKMYGEHYAKLREVKTKVDPGNRL